MEKALLQKIERLRFEIRICEDRIKDVLERIQHYAEYGMAEQVLDLAETLRNEREGIYERRLQIGVLESVLRQAESEEKG